MPAALLSAADRLKVPNALSDGTWLNADPPLAAEGLVGAPTLVVRWRAGDLASVAGLQAAQANAPRYGARVLGLHVPGHPAERDIARL